MMFALLYEKKAKIFYILTSIRSHVREAFRHERRSFAKIDLAAAARGKRGEPFCLRHREIRRSIPIVVILISSCDVLGASNVDLQTIMFTHRSLSIAIRVGLHAQP